MQKFIQKTNESALAQAVRRITEASIVRLVTKMTDDAAAFAARIKA